MNRFEKEPVQAPNVVALKRAKIAAFEKKKQLLFKRSSDQNAPGDQPKITVTNLEERRFGHIYGDRSGIISWGYQDSLNMWLMRRKSGNTKFYKDFHHFNSWTKINFLELANAPFAILQVILRQLILSSIWKTRLRRDSLR